MSPSASARLFIAADPPGDVCQSLADWARACLPGVRGEDRRRAVRLLEPGLMHLTICFLGNRPPGDIGAIAIALHQSRRPVGGLSLGAPLWLPTRHPRALVVEVRDEALQLSGLRRAVLEALPQDGGLQAEAHSFRPHITVARMRADRSGPIGPINPTPALSFALDTLTLYRSHLRAEGASYEPLESVEL